MKCVDCQDVLTEYALDSLGPRECEQVAEHLAAGCKDCQQYLDEVRAEWAALADTLPAATPPAHVKADLLTRIRAESAPSSVRRGYALSPEPEPVILSRDDRTMQAGRWRWQSVLPYIAATLCGIAIGYWFARGAATDSSLVDRYHAQLMQAERTFGTPQMRFAALHLSENRPDVNGYLIWDSVAGELHVYAFDLGALPADSIYRIWFVADDDTWIPAGDLSVGPDGVCCTVLKVPAREEPASRVVITTEPAGGTAADGKTHGPVGLMGEFLQ
jgi:anti-sigma-K factor RskA